MSGCLVFEAVGAEVCATLPQRGIGLRRGGAEEEGVILAGLGALAGGFERAVRLALGVIHKVGAVVGLLADGGAQGFGFGLVRGQVVHAGDAGEHLGVSHVRGVVDVLHELVARNSTKTQLGSFSSRPSLFL